MRSNGVIRLQKFEETQAGGAGNSRVGENMVGYMGIEFGNQSVWNVESVLGGID